MILKRLELSGFKSFAKPTVLQFPAAVSAIVGPNGSGKSNVAEALRWALGEQSIKRLRGKKGEDLIFNGSLAIAKMSRAAVSVVFDNMAKILPVDYDELIITRIAHRSGENEYLINGLAARFKDIIELLGKVGIGTASHYIISQGEADGFLNGSAAERKEIIEESLGLKIYRVKKNDAEKRLEKTAENIKQVEALKRETQHQLKFLKKEVDKAEEREMFKTELKSVYSRYIPQEKHYLKKESEKITAEKHRIAEEIKKIEKNATELPPDNAKEKIKEIESRLNKEESSLEKLRFNRNAMEREMGRIEGAMEYRQSLSVKSLEQEIALSAVPSEEILPIMKLVLDLAVFGAASADILAAKKIFEKIVLLAEEFIAKISIPPRQVFAETDLTDKLKKKVAEIQMLISAIEKKEKETMENIRLFKFEIEDCGRKGAGLEKENYQRDAGLKELKAVLERLIIEEDKVKLRMDELNREETEAGALLGGSFLDFLAPSSRSSLAASGDLDDGSWLSYQDRENFLKQAQRLKIKLEDCGAAGTEVINEYNQTKTRDESYQKEMEDLSAAEKSLREVMAEMADKIENDFLRGIEKINKEFHKFFIAIFGGGKAELSVVKTKRRKTEVEADGMEEEAADGELGKEEENQTGVEISISHPKKRIFSLEMLSGGERSLVAISLLFAISNIKHPPFLILDETDAALDEANSRKYASMLKSLGGKTQLIAITHNRETMSRADILYGVTMGSDGISRLLSVKFDDNLC